MRAADIIAQKGGRVETIDRSATVGNAIDRLAELKIGALLVVDGGRPCGIISERDVVRVLAGAPTGAREWGVAQVMTADLITCGPDETVDQLLDLERLGRDRRDRPRPRLDGGRQL